MKQGSTECIVLQKIAYSDTSIIVRVLTPQEGVKSFIFPGGKSKKKNGQILIPLAIINLDYQTKPNQEMGTIKQVDSAVVMKNIPFDPYKSGILFFMNEVINHTVKEQEENEDLYEFLRNAIQILDLCSNSAHYPIVFLLQLLRFLGLYPKITEHPRYLDLREGTFVSHMPKHPMYVSQETSASILSFMSEKLDGSMGVQLHLSERKKVLNELINYYRVHFDQFKELQSLPVLEATFHD